MRRLVLLDRDGTINLEKHYLSAPDEVVLLPNAAEGIRLLNQLGLTVIIVTNQSAIGRGYFDEARLESVHQRLRQLLGAAGAVIDAVYVCPHRPDEACACRKPRPGLAQRAAQEWQADLAGSFVIGDKICDVELGQRVGASTILVRTGYGAEVAHGNLASPDFIVDDLKAAAELIALRIKKVRVAEPDRC